MALSILDAATRELTLFAAIFLAIGGADDFIVDVLFLAKGLGRRRGSPAFIEERRAETMAYRFAVFVPAWDESAVIAPMLRSMIGRWGSGPYRIYVGT